MIQLIREFFCETASSGAHFHNELCLQMELAIFLRAKLPGRAVHLERPITDFVPRRGHDTKKEIDISIFGSAGEMLAAIEIKYPRNGRIPETMFDYCKDVEFCEAAVDAGFESAYALLVTKDRGYSYGSFQAGIYAHFRAAQPISGVIEKPTGKKDRKAVILGSYPIAWHEGHAEHRYILTEIHPPLRRSVAPSS